MALVLYNTVLKTIIIEPVIPGVPLTLPNNLGIVHGASKGFTVGDFKVVEVVDDGSPPNDYYTKQGSTLVLNGNDLVRTSTFAPQPLDTVKAALTSRIDRDAETSRVSFASPYAGQVGVYLMKRGQALAVLALADPKSASATTYPLVAADIGISATDMQDAATQIKAQADAWDIAAAQIETIRRGADKNVNAAMTVDAAVAIYTACVWPKGSSVTAGLRR